MSDVVDFLPHISHEESFGLMKSAPSRALPCLSLLAPPVPWSPAPFVGDCGYAHLLNPAVFH